MPAHSKERRTISSNRQNIAITAVRVKMILADTIRIIYYDNDFMKIKFLKILQR